MRSAALMMLVALALVCLAPAHAANIPEARQQAVRNAADAARKALVRGPASVSLREQAKLALPEHFGFIPRPQAADYMRALGNRVDDDFIGLIVPLGADGEWLVTLEYIASGYIKDDDARHWDADKLLQSLKDGTEAANVDRLAQGIPELVVTRWVEVPKYEGGSHQLVWAAEARSKGREDRDPTINYNTYVLGREGYVSLNLITSAANVTHDKAAAHALLAATEFDNGKRYGDFNSSTDKVAAYGLAALIAGVAAKKLGLLALLAATVVKFAKLIALAVAGAIAVLSKRLRRRAAPESPQP
jgi:uncharacterized membrane-anchored protein